MGPGRVQGMEVGASWQLKVVPLWAAGQLGALPSSG